MHRCARIIFSLKFHMGQWSPQESVDFLVDRVGHERDNATAEVRRSFERRSTDSRSIRRRTCSAACSCAACARELVDTKIMTNKQFHDEIMRQGNMPIALIRLAVTQASKLTRDMDDQLEVLRRGSPGDGREPDAGDSRPRSPLRSSRS